MKAFYDTQNMQNNISFHNLTNSIDVSAHKCSNAENQTLNRDDRNHNHCLKVYILSIILHNLFCPHLKFIVITALLHKDLVLIPFIMR